MDSYEGRVKVLINKKWGSVCDSDWTTAEANAVYRQRNLPYGAVEAQDNTIWHLYSALRRPQRFYITDMVYNWIMQLCGSSSISASSDIQTHRTEHTDNPIWEHVVLSHGSFAQFSNEPLG